MASLTDTPRGHELEEYFAALLQATGHYVEKNVMDPNILELDIVATDYSAEKARSRLFEIKGTAARLEDVFKLVGHMAYLGLGEGAFVTTEQPRDRELDWFTGVCSRTNIAFVMVPELEHAPDRFADLGFGRADDLAHAIWRFSYWIERLLLKALRDHRPTSEMARVAIDYYHLINSGVFLTPDATEKVRKVYAAYQEHPGLAGELAEELRGRNGGHPLNDALRRGMHREIHAAMYLEHRARITLLKSAVDYLQAGGLVRSTDEGSVTVEFRITDLPQSFLRGVSWLARQSSYWRYPLFWQNYLWSWGGILPDEHRDIELSAIASASGIVDDEAETALRAFDELFPVADGWHRHFTNADYSFVMLTPWHFQGLGVFHQRMRHDAAEYKDYVTTGQYTASDFARRNNLVARMFDEALAAGA